MFAELRAARIATLQQIGKLPASPHYELDLLCTIRYEDTCVCHDDLLRAEQENERQRKVKEKTFALAYLREIVEVRPHEHL